MIVNLRTLSDIFYFTTKYYNCSFPAIIEQSIRYLEIDSVVNYADPLYLDKMLYIFKILAS